MGPCCPESKVRFHSDLRSMGYTEARSTFLGYFNTNLQSRLAKVDASKSFVVAGSSRRNASTLYQHPNLHLAATRQPGTESCSVWTPLLSNCRPRPVPDQPRILECSPHPAPSWCLQAWLVHDDRKLWSMFFRQRA